MTQPRRPTEDRGKGAATREKSGTGEASRREQRARRANWRPEARAGQPTEKGEHRAEAHARREGRLAAPRHQRRAPGEERRKKRSGREATSPRPARTMQCLVGNERASEKRGSNRGEERGGGGGVGSARKRGLRNRNAKFRSKELDNDGLRLVGGKTVRHAIERAENVEGEEVRSNLQTMRINGRDDVVQDEVSRVTLRQNEEKVVRVGLKHVDTRDRHQPNGDQGTNGLGEGRGNPIRNGRVWGMIPRSMDPNALSNGIPAAPKMGRGVRTDNAPDRGMGEKQGRKGDRRGRGDGGREGDGRGGGSGAAGGVREETREENARRDASGRGNSHNARATTLPPN